MRVMDAVRRSGVEVGPQETVKAAAELMDNTGVGALAIVDRGELTGIVTDRDIVRRIVARGTGTDARIDSAMSSPAVSISADADLHSAFAMLRTHGLRRLAVERDGKFVGMITVDDLLIDLAGDLADLARPVTGQTLFGQHDAPAPAAP